MLKKLRKLTEFFYYQIKFTHASQNHWEGKEDQLCLFLFGRAAHLIEHSKLRLYLKITG